MSINTSAITSIIFVAIALAGILVQLGRILEKINHMEKNFNDKVQSIEGKIKETEHTHKECKNDHTVKLQDIRLERNERLDRLENKIDEYQRENKADSERFKAIVESSISHQNNKLMSVCEDINTIKLQLQMLDYRKASSPRVQAVSPPPLHMSREADPYVAVSTARRNDPRRE